MTAAEMVRELWGVLETAIEVCTNAKLDAALSDSDGSGK